MRDLSEEELRRIAPSGADRRGTAQNRTLLRFAPPQLVHLKQPRGKAWFAGVSPIVPRLRAVAASWHCSRVVTTPRAPEPHFPATTS